MTEPAIWLTLIGMGLVTYGLRLSVIALLPPDADLPLNLRRALRYVPPAVLSAIIATEVLLPGNLFSPNPLANPRLLAALVAFVVAWRSRSVLLTIAAGMLCFWGLGALFAAM